MTDITVIILVGNEELHIGRCLEKLAPLEPRQIIVVESQKGDRTHEIAIEHGATCVWHDWPGNQAAQFNWTLDNVDIDGAWVLRLDADEYLESDTIEEIKDAIKTTGEEVTTMSMRLGRTFLGEKVRFGVGEIEIVRLMRKGCARYGEAIMDERIIADHGVNHRLCGRFIDDNLNGIEWWTNKHLNYALREAQMAVEGAENGNKKLYYKLPPYFRAFFYWAVRYILRGGFLDGKAGFVWHFFHALWYRSMVDYMIGRLNKARQK